MSKLLKRALPHADWAIPCYSHKDVYEVRRLRGGIDKYIVVVCGPQGNVQRVDSVRGMSFERAKARATWLADANRVARVTEEG